MNAPAPTVAFLLALTAFVLVVLLLRSRVPDQLVRSGVLVGLVTPLLAIAYAAWQLWNGFVGWREVALLLGLYAVLGVTTTVGYHRLLTHRSFETGPATKLVLLALSAMGHPTRPIDFAANHLKHHANSDREGDPHSPRDGFWHSHMGWLLTDRPAERERYCRHLLSDPVVRFVDRTSFGWLALGLAIPFLVAGWSGFVWGGLVRLGLSLHIASSVNSVCHAFGSQPFKTRDQSRNNLLVALLAHGEGWHNNHHAFPSAPYFGRSWRQPDLGGLLIRALIRTGLAWNPKEPSPELVGRLRVTADST